MNPKRATYTLLVILAVLGVFLISRWHEPARKEMFDRHPDRLVYTAHALCRMECRHISKTDIGQIIQRGIINLSKSYRRDRPCPTFALQGKTDEGENIRVIFAQCAEETRVVTCYNLREDFECHCPSAPPGVGRENKN